MKINQNQVIKHLGLIAKASGLVPIMILLSYLIYRTYDTRYFYIQLLGIIGSGYLGYIQMKFRKKIEVVYEKKHYLVLFCIGAGYVVSLVLLVQLSRYISVSGWIMRIVFFILGLIMYIIFMKDCERHYSCTLALEIVCMITGIYTLAMILTRYDALVVIYIFVIVTYIFIKNQVKIELLLERTQ